MKAEQMTEEVYDKLIQLNYHRKVNSVFSEVTNSVDFNDFDIELKEVIISLPVQFHAVGTDLMDIELDGKQQFYILNIGQKDYLVDTQGYSYPRYIIELKNLDYHYKDDPYEYMEGLVRIADSQIFDAVVKSLVIELRKDFHQKDILNYLQIKLDLAIEAAKK
jgi:hypothetical protein